MKKLFRLFAIMAVALFSTGFIASCSDDDDEKDEIVSVSDLPPAAETFLKQYYASAKVTTVVRETGHGVVEYDVKLSDGSEVTFDVNGLWTDVDAPQGRQIPSGIALPAIEAYVINNYPGQGINEISRIATGYEIELTNGLDAYFDAAGNFIRASF